MVAGVVGAVAGGLFQSKGAKKAAAEQAAMGRQQLALQERIYDESVDRGAPWVQGGQAAQGALLNMLGLASAPMIGGTAPTVEAFNTPGQGGYYVQPRGDRGEARYVPGTPGSTGYRVNGQEFTTLEDAQAYANANKTGGTPWSWQADPGYQFRLGEGLNALEASAAARGGLYSGQAMKAAQQFGQDYGSAEFGNIFNRLAGVSNTGLSAASMGQAAGQNYANGASNAYGAIGNAQAAGAIGQANAWNTAIGNGLGAWNYQQQMGGQNGNGAGYNWLFGGPGLGSFV